MALSPQQLAAWACAFELRLRGLAQRVHPSWWAPLPVPAATERLPAAHAGWLQLPWPCDCAPDAPGNAVALMEPTAARRLLVVRALLWRRQAVRLAVLPAARRAVQALVGDAAYQALVNETQDIVDATAASTALPCTDTLAWEGFCLLRRDGTLSDAACRRLLRLEFPQDAAEPPLTTGSRDGGGRWLLARVPLFVEELPSWWSGCAMPTVSI